ncbi:MAG: hypothetical protein HUU21_06550, partial [Polyangiaceae bacterium]|nr:hypothetical protein [Polyangiaceae bacterium]
MSKRLRESILASKKGRLLRAKAEQRRTSNAPSLPRSGPTSGELTSAIDVLQEMGARPAEARPIARIEVPHAKAAPAAPAAPAKSAPFVPAPPARSIVDDARSTAPAMQVKAVPFAAPKPA